jgi:holin (3TMs family)
MGMIAALMTLLFGQGRNVITETVGQFRENAEKGAERQAAFRAAALAQFASEFTAGGAARRRGWFDRLVDGLNRLPRPMMAFGILGLMVAAMTDPLWFAARMQGVALVPEPLWWLMGVIVSFYFGARQSEKNQNFQQSLGASLARTPEVMRNIERLRRSGTGANDGPEMVSTGENAALTDWRRAPGAARRDGLGAVS